MQNLGISLYGLSYRRERLGGVFRDSVESFKERDRWDNARMQEFLRARLRTVATQAFREVPYYSQLWRKIGITHADLDRLEIENLSKLPITPKRDLVGNADRFVLQNAVRGKKLRRYYSSGSTGTPIACVLSAEDHQRFLAAREVRSFGWAGASILSPRSMIGGRMVVPNPNSPPPYYRYNWAERQLYFSAFHISPGRVRDYVDGFCRYRPMVLTGYAHSHFTLARMMVARGLQLDYAPTALVLSSEKLTREMKKTIRRAFRARAYEEYGAVEQCVLATECEAGNLHINSDFGLVEIVDENNVPVPAGVPGRIVCTSLLSDTQPLIRYDIGDIGTLSSRHCACGRNHLPVLEEVIGRVEDAIVGSDGRQTVRMHGLFIDLPHVLEGQVVQESLDCIRVRVVAVPGFNQEERETIRERLEERLGKIRVLIDTVDQIEGSARGKFKAVVSLLGDNSSALIPEVHHVS